MTINCHKRLTFKIQNIELWLFSKPKFGKSKPKTTEKAKRLCYTNKYDWLILKRARKTSNLMHSSNLEIDPPLLPYFTSIWGIPHSFILWYFLLMIDLFWHLMSSMLICVWCFHDYCLYLLIICICNEERPLATHEGRKRHLRRPFYLENLTK